ncbi:MAG: DMT family transporter [Deltaproteobacteria bacterium]
MDGLLFAALCLVWSTTWAGIRLCERGYPPLWGAALRFVLAAAILGGVWAVRRFRRGRRAADSGAGQAGPSRHGRALGLVLAAGVVNALSYALIYLAERRLTGGTSALLAAAHPFFALGAAVALGYERLRLGRTVGLVVGLGGVLLLVGGLHAGAGSAAAAGLLLFAAAVLWPTYTVLLRRAGSLGLSLFDQTSAFLAATAICLCAGAAVLEGAPHARPTGVATAALIYLSVVGTIAAWGLYGHLLRRLPMSVLSTMVFIEPALALGIDWLLGEPGPGRGALLGGSLILVGVLLSSRGREDDRPPVPEVPLVYGSAAPN